nr:MAG TPA: hypothetical protein [Crassvirales sp.]DAR45793.1 MAG TPA: hypothetical protein [Bacteriophage sp.]
MNILLLRYLYYSCTCYFDKWIGINYLIFLCFYFFPIKVPESNPAIFIEILILFLLVYKNSLLIF